MGKLPCMFTTIFICFGHNDSYNPLITHQCCAVCSDGYRVGRLRCHTTPWVSLSNDVIPHILQHRIQQLLQVAPNMQLVGVVKRDSTRPPLLSILTHLKKQNNNFESGQWPSTWRPRNAEQQIWSLCKELPLKSSILELERDPFVPLQIMVVQYQKYEKRHLSRYLYEALPSSPSSASTHVHSFTEEWTKEVESNISNFVRESIKEVIFPTSFFRLSSYKF